jgi:NAD dependent epimerase/dehydratase family enzyme
LGENLPSDGSRFLSDAFKNKERDHIHFYLAVRSIVAKLTKGEAPGSATMNAKAWEKALRESEVPEVVRKVALRSAIVLANEPGSVFAYLRRIARLGLGGRMGSGRQKMSWIHIDDFCGVIEWMIGREELQNFYNLAAPYPTDNAGCMAGFRRIAGRGFGLPATRWMLKIGAFMMRTETELVLKSRWVLPRRLQEEGYDFQRSTFDEALDELVKRGE